MPDDELALQFDDLSLVGCEGEVVLERPERTDCGHIAVLGLEVDGERQGSE